MTTTRRPRAHGPCSLPSSRQEHCARGPQNPPKEPANRQAAGTAEPHAPPRDSRAATGRAGRRRQAGEHDDAGRHAHATSGLVRAATCGLVRAATCGTHAGAQHCHGHQDHFLGADPGARDANKRMPRCHRLRGPREHPGLPLWQQRDGEKRSGAARVSPPESTTRGATPGLVVLEMEMKLDCRYLYLPCTTFNIKCTVFLVI